MSMQTNFLNVENLSMYYWTLRGYVKAVDDVSLSMSKGDVLGLVGESGCGKTSAMLTILRLLPRNAEIKCGKIYFDGIDLLKMPMSEFRSKIRWKRISTVFQGSMNALHPMMKIGDQLAEPIMLHEKVSKEEALNRARKLLELVGMDPSRIDRYPHELSGGMKQRAVIAMSLACNPDLVIADEPTTALDVVIAAQVMKLLKELQSKLGISLIIVTHDLSVVAEVCDKVAIMYAGKVVESGSVEKIFGSPAHPYTKALIAAFPSILGPKVRLSSIPGDPPDLLAPPPGCRFHPRCSFAMEICRLKEPSSVGIGENHIVACHLY